MYEHFYIFHIRVQTLLQSEDDLHAAGIRQRLIAEISARQDTAASLALGRWQPSEINEA